MHDAMMQSHIFQKYAVVLYFHSSFAFRLDFVWLYIGLDCLQLVKWVTVELRYLPAMMLLILCSNC